MSLNLNKLENKLDEALSNETSETLNKFLNDKRMENNKQQTAVELYTEDYALIVSDEQIKDVRQFIGQYHLEGGLTINKFPNYLTDLGACKLIIAHRPLTDAPILKGVPLINETYGGGEQ